MLFFCNGLRDLVAQRIRSDWISGASQTAARQSALQSDEMFLGVGASMSHDTLIIGDLL